MDIVESLIRDSQNFNYAVATAGIFIGLLIWERLAPRRQMVGTGVGRWLTNISFGLANTLMVRFLAPAVVVGAAIFASDRSLGIFNNIDLPPAIAFFVVIVLLDFGIYVQHLLMHLVPIFWRVHKIHHSDTDFDVTTGIRFHPIEIFLSLGFKFLLVVTVGAPVAAVVVYEVVLTAASLFTHGNVQITPVLERAMRFILVTPDMHRIHHSVESCEYNRNFGNFLSLWDRLCRTYLQASANDDRTMEIGLPIFRRRRDQMPDRLFIQCFLRQGDQS